MKIAINGFGRIGRTFLRTIFHNPEIQKKLEVVAINIGPADVKAVGHMFKYDTLMGTFAGDVSYDNTQLIVNNTRIALLAEVDPEKCNWKSFGVTWVVDASGRFTKRMDAMKHIQSGAEKVLISAPAKNEDVNIIPGVNDHEYNPEKDKIVSLGSCTTNAFIPLVKVIQDNFGIENGFMTTIHAYTNSQVLLDVEDSDLRRSRAAALNIIPTTTGASKMLGKLIPELDGKLPALAIRVPVAKVSLIDLVVQVKQEISTEKLHEVFKRVSKNEMKGILDISFEPLVSCDYGGNNHSVVVDGLLTQAHEKSAKVFGWYDNEWGYSMRLRDFLVSTLK